MLNKGYIPVRMCVVCRNRRYKSELIRLALDHTKMVVRDSRSCMPGRGAYVCSECLDKLSWGRSLAKAFRWWARGLRVETLRTGVSG